MIFIVKITMQVLECAMVCMWYAASLKRLSLWSIKIYTNFAIKLQFTNSIKRAISIAPLQVHNYILRDASDTARTLCQSFTPKRHMQLRVKDLPKVPTWRLERDSNTRPFGRKATNLPLSRHAQKKLAVK